MSEASPLIEAVVGWPGSGLTRACRERAEALVAAGATGRVVLLVADPHQAAALGSALVGATVTTFAAFVDAALARHWSALGVGGAAPVWLDGPLALHALDRACTLCPNHAAAFADCPLRPQHQLSQIHEAATLAAAARLAPQEAGERLARAWAGAAEARRTAQFSALGCCLERARAEGLACARLDPAARLDLFARTLLDFDAFWADFDHLIVDRAEESPAIALDFYGRACERLASAFFAYTVGGGAHPASAPTAMAEFLVRRTRYRYLTSPALEQGSLAWLGDRLARRLSADFRNPLSTQVPEAASPPALIEAQTPAEAAERTAAQIRALIADGIAPDRIAVIDPHGDAALAGVLAAALDTPPCVLGPTRPPVQRPTVRALLTLLELAHPAWGVFPSFAEVGNCFGLLLGLDPVRAELLAAEVYDPIARTLREPAGVRRPERIGFRHLRRYENFWSWLAEQRRTPSSADPSAVLEQVASVAPASAPALAEVSGLVALVQAFNRAFPDEPADRLLALVRSGAGGEAAPPPEPGRVVIAPPALYLRHGLSSDHQFWCDAGAEGWQRSAWQPLYNPRVLSPEWNGMPFGEGQDRRWRSTQLARTLFALCCRTKKQVWLVRSLVNARGEESTGVLAPLLREIVAEEAG